MDPKESTESLKRDLEELQKLYSHSSVGSQDVNTVPETDPSHNPGAEHGTEEDHARDIDAESVFNNFIENWKQLYSLGTESNAQCFLNFMQRATMAMT